VFRLELNRKQISSIIEAFRASPRGMNVTEVAKVTGLNRSTVAKYLEMLFVSGRVDMRSFGTSKVYYISQRMPISAFLNFSSDLILVLDQDLRVLNANDQFFEFTNTRREDVVHKNMDHFAFPLRFDPSIDPYVRDAIVGTSKKIESNYRKKDRGYYFNIKFIPLVLDDGEKGATIIFEDITDKKLAEKALRDANDELERKVRERTMELERANEALRKSETHLTEAQKIAHLGYWSFDLSTGGISASDETCRLFGIEPGSKWDYAVFRSRVHPDDMALVEKTDEDAIKKNMPIDYEYRLVLPDGSQRVVHTIGEVKRDATGNALEIFGALQDVTEHKRMEKALRESEEKYRKFVESVQVVVWEVDENMVCRYMSPMSRSALGYEPEEMVGKEALDMMTPEASKRILEMAGPSLDRHIPFELADHILLRKDGKAVAFKTNGMPIFDGQGRYKGYRGVTRQIDSKIKN
jgi:PAS domain S-box-containing protein